MKQKQVSILIIGGGTSAGVNLKPYQGYVSRLLHQLKQTGWQPRVELHTPIHLETVLPLLYRLNLNRFDLIVLELSHPHLQRTSCGYAQQASRHKGDSVIWSDMATQYGVDTPVQASSYHRTFSLRLGDWINAIKLRAQHALGRSARLNDVEERLSDVLYYLEPYRRRLVMLTPMPHPEQASGWLRRQGRLLVRKQGREHLVPVFDTASVIQERYEYFDDSDCGHLSAVAHDLLGSALYDFIQINALLPDQHERHPRQY